MKICFYRLRSLFSGLSAVLILAACLTGCSSADSDRQRIAELEAENAALRSQIETLTSQLGSASAAVLRDWELTGSVWSGNDGATVTLRAMPLYHVDTQQASLLVCLDEQEIENIPCTWDGDAFTAAASLSAADGYWYYCILISPDGVPARIPLTTPMDPVVPELVYLDASLSAYCNLFLEDYQAADGILTLVSGSIQVQLPRMAANERVPELTEAALSFRLDGEEIERQTVTLSPGEGVGLYEAMISGISFPIPRMENESQLELWLEATLSDGQVLYSNGGNWYTADGTLNMVVG